MDKLRIGVIVEENALATEGGGYTYYKTFLNSINRYAFHPEIEIVNIVFSRKYGKGFALNKQVVFVRKTLFQFISHAILDLLYRVWYRTVRNRYQAIGESIFASMAAIRNRSAIPVLIKENIDLVYYLKPEENILDYPLIITHWDVGHKSMYPFPEVAMNGNFKKREEYYVKMLSKAFLILCESETGAAELLNYYAVNPGKVKVLPLFSGDVIRQEVSAQQQQQILLTYGLEKGSFYIYPAQFWAHKNHYNLVQAFHALLGNAANSGLKLVLCGTDKGNLPYIRKLVLTLGLKDKVLFPGFVSDPELYTLYTHAVALVMPTFLGPTNIPLIEAARLYCPVLCSDIAGHKEILNNAAMYFNPSDVAEITRCMQQILNNDTRKQLIALAYRRIRESGFNVEKSIPLLQNILLNIKPVRKAWGFNLSCFISFITCADINGLHM